jgi:hypothetical protein
MIAIFEFGLSDVSPEFKDNLGRDIMADPLIERWQGLKKRYDEIRGYL